MTQPPQTLKKSHNGHKGAEFHYLGKLLIIVKVHIVASLFYWGKADGQCVNLNSLRRHSISFRNAY